jgi:Protein of unknown function (DUF4242)
MLFAAKCYWPGVTEADLETIAHRATPTVSATTRTPVTYLGSLLFTDDDLVLCLFDGPSRPAVKQASDRAGIPSERLMSSIWLGARRNPEGLP